MKPSALILFLLVPLCGCLRLGGGARLLVDPRTGETSVGVRGNFGGVALEDMAAESFERTDARQGFHLGLSLGGAYDLPRRTFALSVGFGLGALLPHCVLALTFEPKLGFDGSQLYGLYLSAGPRIELTRSERGGARSASEVSIPAVAGFTVGDGFRPLLGVGVDFHHLRWARSLDYH